MLIVSRKAVTGSVIGCKTSASDQFDNVGAKLMPWLGDFSVVLQLDVTALSHSRHVGPLP
jgi:hypothetical protein